jgi:hypothetical protein
MRDNPNSTAYPTRPMAATGTGPTREYTLRFTRSQLKFSLRSQYSVYSVFSPLYWFFERDGGERHPHHRQQGNGQQDTVHGRRRPDFWLSSWRESTLPSTRSPLCSKKGPRLPLRVAGIPAH